MYCVLKRLTRSWSSSFLLCLLLAVNYGLSTNRVAAQDFPKTIEILKNEANESRYINLGIGRSVIINSEEEVRDVLVSDPRFADAVISTKNRIYLLGKEAGHASLVLFGHGGRQVASIQLNVQSDTSELHTLLQKLLPNSAIEAEVLNGSVILSGKAVSASDAQMAANIAGKFIGEDKKVFNAIAVAEKDQVQLRVSVAEVARTIVKQLGVNLSASFGIGNYGLGFATANGFNVNPAVTGQSIIEGGFSSNSSSIGGQIKALQRDGIVRTLAEPTLVAISGENASFLAGGEFPIPVSYDDDAIGIEFKPYGVGLDFTPVVLSNGRIKLRVKTEVSELTSEGAVNLIDGIAISGLSVRRAESTVEVPSGGTIVMAGLLKDDYGQEVTGVPGLRDLPILGPLFKSRDFLSQQTELVVFVTPYVVRPVAENQLAKPSDNLLPPNDSDTVFFNQLNRIYRSSGAPGKGQYHGKVGYIYE
ncbi:type II and III secretion system protein family protein [Flexibacterium corallicola]|uniref:type II and III secretion system protein family protein n=1 Tax=Flexibacterium corallicola TaxID=3037259 RepID=UPI00286F8BE8|nr:type II and III secretion system protein family protein [Pseudovibrio sp. M1P-2-3]